MSILVGVIGNGFVGQAVCSILRAKYATVDVNDSFEKLLEMEPDVIFICVPTPPGANGCDDSIVMDYIEKLVDFSGIVIVKSTVPPNTVAKILTLRPSTIFWPELLREKSALKDIRYPRIIVLGGTWDMCMRMTKFIKEQTIIESESFCCMDPVEASIFKYTLNSFLAMKVTFVHQMFLWMREMGASPESWDRISLALAREGRMGTTHMKAPGEHGFGFSGSCLPKDMAALIAQAKSDGFELSLLNAVMAVNQSLRWD